LTCEKSGFDWRQWGGDEPSGERCSSKKARKIQGGELVHIKLMKSPERKVEKRGEIRRKIRGGKAWGGEARNGGKERGEKLRGIHGQEAITFSFAEKKTKLEGGICLSSIQNGRSKQDQRTRNWGKNNGKKGKKAFQKSPKKREQETEIPKMRDGVTPGCLGD